MAHDAADGAVAVADVESTEPVALEECGLAYGRDLLAYLLGAGTERPLATWRLETDATEGGWERLRVCHHVLQTFEQPGLARAWLRQASPRFGGHTPAWAVRTGDPGLLAAVAREAERRASQSRL